MALVLTISCGDDTSRPAAPPTAPTPPTSSAVWTYEGRIVGNPTRAPVAGALIRPAAGGSAVTDSAGAFAIQIAGSGDPVVTIEATGMLQRRTTLGGRQDRTGLTIDVISMTPPFSLNFYRQLARDAFDRPNGPLQSIRRWDEQPNFYVRTTDQDGGPVEQSRIDTVIASIRNIVPQATAGNFEAGAIETGPDDRPPRQGWVRVLFRSEPGFTACGTGTVGVNPGVVNLSLNCAGDPIGGPPEQGPTAAAVAHEVGHALGLWHVPEGLMGRGGPGLQPGASPPQLRYDMTDIEKYHAAIIYSRPVGNADPDVDPFQFQFLRASEAAPVVYCFIR